MTSEPPPVPGPDLGTTPSASDGGRDADPGLRGRLIAAGVELVHAEGAQALTLREIARRAGVSHGAPRRYFPTHLDLLSAIAREGFTQLGARVAATAGDDDVALAATTGGEDVAFDATTGGEDVAFDAPASDGPQAARARLDALARAYLDFALTRRGMYELMFRHDLLESGRLGLRDTSLPLFALLTGLVDHALAGSGTTSRPDSAVVAGALWANLHGIAQLWSWGSLALATRTENPEDLDTLLRAALDAHLGPTGGER
ncbi:TetR/AcrR family transcriptional regulator [Streptomyces sp. JL2001]|uniref:TetR/AcrR family transcriptional regulator n=1 Tax=Streptomyces sp. JL2001 TaxID=3342488 RepID=UPI003D807F0B